MQDKELLYKIGITLIKGIGNVNGKQLIAYCGGVEAVFKESKSNLEKIPNIGRQIINAISGQTVLSLAEKEMQFIDRYNIQPLYYFDKDYPDKLKQCNDGPIMLYYKGTADLNAQKTIAIVGSRKATDYGKGVCEKIVEELAPHQPLIVSGLAYGIDVTAHKAAIKNMLNTIGVLGHGLKNLYPAGNRKVAAAMCSQGGLLSEFLSNAPSSKENFPKRNRIIAGMADAVVVVESAEKGGSLITAEIANGYNREVFAIPGRISDSRSKGCNKLIFENKAMLVQSAKDIEAAMCWEDTQTQNNPSIPISTPLTIKEEQVVDLLKDGALNIDAICRHASLDSSLAASTLLQLEFSGIVKCLPGKMYQLN